MKTRTIVANLGFLAGALFGSALGLFGLLVGCILGFMVDTIRAELGLRTYLTRPEAPAPDEAVPGLIAALALANADAGELAGAEKRSILEGFLDRTLSPQTLEEGLVAFPVHALTLIRRLIHRPWPGSILALLDEDPKIDDALLSRRLALEGSETARFLLAEASWALEARKGELGWEREREIVASLADRGLAADKIILARARYFPGWRSPWEVLGLTAGASKAAVRKAYRNLSKRWHPDSSGSSGGSDRFREAKAAYEILSRLDENEFGPESRQQL